MAVTSVMPPPLLNFGIKLKDILIKAAEAPRQS
jgi:hypothetical protein